MGRILTEADLRSRCLPETTRRVEVEADVFVTEAARAYLDKRNIRLVTTPGAGMPMTPLTRQGGRTFLDAASGLPLGSQKPEEMTHLRGNLLVPKTNLRIVLRGRLDSLEAAVLEAQWLAHSEGNDPLRHKLGELLEHLRRVLGAEVKEEPLVEQPLFGLNQAELRRVSHNVQAEFGMPHPVPDWGMGLLALRLNSLRAQVREAELAAVAAFSAPGETSRPDLIRELNRLSSGVYILFCQLVATGGKSQPHGDFPIEASARHIHLTRQAVEALFGVGARLTSKRPLSQPGEFLCEQRVCLTTPRGEIANVAVLGPEREAVQVELSLTDARILGLRPPVNLSGDLRGAADVSLKSDKGVFAAPASAIVARAHIHMTPADAARLGVKDGQRVGVQVDSGRSVIFEQVPVRVKDSFALAMHLDLDEANACGLEANTRGTILYR